MDIMLFKLVVVLAVLKCTVIQALQLTPNGTVTVVCGMPLQLICTTSMGVTWSKGNTTLRVCNSFGICPSPTLDHYTFSHNGSSFIMTFSPIKLIDDGVTFSCDDTVSNPGSSTMNVKVVPNSSAVVSQTSKSDDKIYLETNCLDSADSVKVEWHYEDSGTYKELEHTCQEEFVSDRSCAANASTCIGSTFKTFRKKTKFDHDAECKLTIRAKITTSYTFYGPQPEPVFIIYRNACIKARKDVRISPYCSVVAALFAFAVAQLIIIVICASSCCCNNKIALNWLMRIANWANFITVIWSAVMVGLLLTECPDRTDWCIILAGISLYTSAWRALLKICLQIYSCYAEDSANTGLSEYRKSPDSGRSNRPWSETVQKKLWDCGKDMEGVCCCGYDIEQKDLRAVAVVLLISSTGIIIIAFTCIALLLKGGIEVLERQKQKWQSENAVNPSSGARSAEESTVSLGKVVISKSTP